MAVRPSIKAADTDSLMGVLTPARPAEQKPLPQAAAAQPSAPTQERRDGMKSIGFWTSAEARRQLHMIALTEDVTAERLLNEALNLFFRARGVPPIAPT